VKGRDFRRARAGSARGPADCRDFLACAPQPTSRHS